MLVKSIIPQASRLGLGDQKIASPVSHLYQAEYWWILLIWSIAWRIPQHDDSSTLAEHRLPGNETDWLDSRVEPVAYGREFWDQLLVLQGKITLIIQPNSPKIERRQISPDLVYFQGSLGDESWATKQQQPLPPKPPVISSTHLPCTYSRQNSVSEPSAESLNSATV